MEHKELQASLDVLEEARCALIKDRYTCKNHIEEIQKTAQEAIKEQEKNITEHIDPRLYGINFAITSVQLRLRHFEDDGSDKKVDERNVPQQATTTPRREKLSGNP